MMKRMISPLLFLVIFTCISSAQNDLKLYLVMFTSEDVPTNFHDPRSELEQDSTLLSILWRLDDDTLTALDTLNLNPFGAITKMEHCRHFDEEEWIYIQEREFIPMFLSEERYDSLYMGREHWEEDTYISTLDYGGDTIFVRRMVGSKNLLFENKSSYHGAYFNDNQIYYEFSFIGGKEHFGGIIVDKTLENGVVVNSRTFISNVYSKFESGLFFRYLTGNILDTSNNYKERIYYKEKYDNYINWPNDNRLNIPESDTESVLYKNFNYLLYTARSKYIIGRKSRWKKNEDTTEIYYLMDKSNFGVWDTIFLPRDVNTFNVYEDRYLYGTHIDSEVLGKYDPKRDKDSTLSYMVRNPEKYSWKYANYPNLIYSKGVIFIYDLEARKYYELQLPDRDSEFLQIIDGWIYLRVYDEIWRMRFNRKENPFRLDEKEVLIKDKAVIPNVHHIFLKKESPLVEKWITSKP